MKRNKRILISGASIAGPTLAYWLHHFGFEVTVVERAPSLRTGGQNIDIKGSAQKIAAMMGIEALISDANTGEVGIKFVNEKNQVKAALAKEGGFTAELEILRGDLSKILYEHTCKNATYIFGDFITALDQDKEKVNVTFDSGKVEVFDLVIAADGIRSRTRNLMFGNEPKLEFIGLYTAYLTVPKSDTDNEWARWCNGVNSKVIFIRPDNVGTTRVSFSFLSDDLGYEKLSVKEQKELLKAKFSTMGWEAPRILRALDEIDDLYFDGISQVKAPRWTNGRFAMIGDAAYCPTPVTGMGTGLAMIGAYVLAGELGRNDNYEKAFKAYEDLLRPIVEKIQDLPPGVPWMAHPKTRTGIALLNFALGVYGSKPVNILKKLFGGKPKDKYDDGIVLPDYKKPFENNDK
jgi:2-polyprenyl-6-methoxyphenol hydroxylase-like FAD-dependent oxidoreductase